MKGYLTFGNEWIVRNLGHLQSRNEWIVRNLGHLQSRNEWIVRNLGHLGVHRSCGNPAMGWMKVFETKNL